MLKADLRLRPNSMLLENHPVRRELLLDRSHSLSLHFENPRGIIGRKEVNKVHGFESALNLVLTSLTHGGFREAWAERHDSSRGGLRKASTRTGTTARRRTIGSSTTRGNMNSLDRSVRCGRARRFSFSIGGTPRSAAPTKEGKERQ